MKQPDLSLARAGRSVLLLVLIALVLFPLSAADPNGLGYDFGLSLDNSSKLNIPTGNLSAGVATTKGQEDQTQVNMDQSDNLTLWGTLYFDRSLSLLAKINGSYTAHYRFDNPPVATPLQPFAFDVQSLVLNGGFKDPFGPGTKLNFQLGRTGFRDFSGVVLNSTLDGFTAKTGTSLWSLSLGVGTSAIQSKAGSTIAISKADTLEKAVLQNYEDLVTVWASPRLVGQVQFDLNRFLWDQSLSLAVLGQLDMRDGLGRFAHDYPELLSSRRFPVLAVDGGKLDPTVPDKGAPVSMAYAGLDLSGRIVGPLYYELWGYGGLGQTLTVTGTYTPATTKQELDPVTHKPVAKVTPAVLQTYRTTTVVNGIGNLNLSLLLPEALYSVVSLNALLGSWDTDENGTAATVTNNSTDPKDVNKATDYYGWFGVTRTGGQVIFNPQPVNMLTLQLAYSLKPFSGLEGNVLDNFTASLVGTAFIRPFNGYDATGAKTGSGAITESGVDAKSKENYLATEADLNLAWRASADLGIGLGVGVLMPNPVAMTRKVETKIQLSLNWGL